MKSFISILIRIPFLLLHTILFLIKTMFRYIAYAVLMMILVGGLNWLAINLGASGSLIIQLVIQIISILFLIGFAYYYLGKAWYNEVFLRVYSKE